MDTVTAFELYVRSEYRTYQSETVDRLLEFINTLPIKQQVIFKDFIEEHHNHAFDSNEFWKDAITARLLASEIPGNAYEVLGQLVDGPKFDGDVVSKNGKAWLYSNKLAVRVCNNGEHGDNAANYLGWQVYKLVKENKGNYKLPTS